jgi:hypothetical protein
MLYQGDTALYQLVVKDVSQGTRKPVPTAPIRGRYTAEQKLELIRRANRDPRLQYELETAREPRPQGLEDSGIFEHHFRG